MEIAKETSIAAKAAVLLLAAAVAARAQTAPSFEVASVKISPPRQGEAGLTKVDSDPALVRYANITLLNLITVAYHVDNRLVVGGPAWLGTEQYDVAAKLPPGTSRDRIPAMLQTLLEERFKLAVHRETREQRVYLLVIGKNGSKLEKGREGPNQMLPGRIMGGSIPIATLAGMLSHFLGEEVVDRTGLAGTFHIDLNWQTPIDPASTAELFDALQEQLGLKLEAGRAPVERLVVDRAGQIPVEN